MHTKLFFAAVCCCLLASATTTAQEKASKDQLLTVHEDIVIPSMVAKYEKAAKNLAELVSKSNIPATHYTAANLENFVYLYFSPVENMADLDKMNSSWGEIQKKVGKEAFDAAMKGFDGCYASHKNYTVRMRNDLSYNPDYGSAISDGMLFRHWDFYYIHPGMEDQADAIAKEWVALNKKIGMPGGYRLYSGAFGSDTPVFVVSQSGKNAMDFYTRQEAWMKKAGEVGKALWSKTWTVVRKYESHNGMIRPDLSAMPKEMATK